MLPGQSAPNIGPFNPLLLAAATALSGQQSKSVFNSTSLGVPLPMVNLSAFPNIFHTQMAPEGREGSAEHSKEQRQEQNAPTLASLLASASVGTPQRNRQQRQIAISSTTEPPPAKRLRLQQPPEAEEFCEHSTSLFGTSTSSAFPKVVSNASGTKESSTASLLSALTAASGKFPLAAATPPALPSPPCATNALASSVAHQPQKSAISPTGNTLGRRLSSLSASSSTSGSATVDQAYYERRRKNNDAAKRSRDTRRLKEEVTAQRAAYLERENNQLKKQVGLLSAELAKHKAVLLSLAPPPNVPSMLQNTPPKASNASCRRQCHVLASPTSTTGVNEAIAECHSGKKDTVAEENGIRSWKRAECSADEKGNDDEPNTSNRPSGLIDANIS
ncbi:hypothetical protein GPALN_013049 [Globodera pallida]|nr:hypothetical protein GPALN_013049 [Globodera pallida]